MAGAVGVVGGEGPTALYIAVTALDQPMVARMLLAAVVARLKALGFPWPAPTANQVRDAVERGEWPPR